MAFTCAVEIVPLQTGAKIGRLTLKGELDAAAAAEFRSAIEKAAEAKITKLVLLMAELEYMASAGLRALVFAKQKIGPQVDIYMVGVQEPVLETLRMTGFHNSVIVLEQYDAARIEG